MDTSELKPNTVIIGERNYAAALDLVIAQAKHELLIFDQDLSKGDYASQARYALLRDFLNISPQNKLTIIVQNTEFFSLHCPRLFELLTIYGHRMMVYETNDVAKIAKDCFVIADKRHYLRRFHIDQARFKYKLDDEDALASLLLRYGELKAETADAISITQLGL